jgi:DNA-binding PadR family transcriptional regulator
MNEPSLLLTRAQVHILLALADREQHGYAIMREVETETEGRIKLGPGTLYGAIKTLLEARLIAEAGPRIDPDVNDERRRYYKLSDLGRRALGVELKSLAALVERGRERKVLPVSAVLAR